MIVAITGGAGALGSALAKVLLNRGEKVVLLDMPWSKERLAALEKELGVATFASDFAKADDWKAALDHTLGKLGGYPSGAALIAGGWAGGEPVHAAKDESAYARMMSSNVDSAFRALHALLPPMVAAKKGSIVVIGSRAVERPWTSSGSAAYAASKSAVVALARATAEEVLEHGVRINAILPSTMDTPANRAAMPDADPSKWVTTESASSVIAFLLGEDSRDVSGAVIPVYGRA